MLAGRPLATRRFTTPGAALAAHVDVPEIDGDEPGPFSLANPRRIREHLEGAEFIDVSIVSVAEPMRLGSDVDDVVEFIRGRGRGRGPGRIRGRIRDLLADADEITMSKALDSVRAALRPYASPDGVLLGGAAWLVTAHRPA